MYRRLATVVSIVASLSLSGAPRALADEARGDNIVSVHNDSDGSVRTRATTSVAQNPGPSVLNANEAFAYASCTDCRTVAAAVQVLVVEGPTSDYEPANVAVALNENCLRCQTFAFARQVVLTPGLHIEIGDDAEEQIGFIQSRIRSAAAASSVPFEELTAQLDDLTEQLVSVVQGEIDRAGTTASRDDDRRVEKHDQDED